LTSRELVLAVNNLFDDKQTARDATGVTPAT